MLDRKKHRQEVEALKADNRQKEMDLSKMYVDEEGGLVGCASTKQATSSLQLTAYGLQEDGTPTISSKLSAVSKVPFI